MSSLQSGSKLLVQSLILATAFSKNVRIEAALAINENIMASFTSGQSQAARSSRSRSIVDDDIEVPMLAGQPTSPVRASSGSTAIQLGAAPAESSGSKVGPSGAALASQPCFKVFRLSRLS